MLYAYRGTVAHQVVEDAAGFKFPEGESLEDMGFLSEERMLVAFCFKHGAFPAPEGSDPYEESTWHLVECPGCKKARVAKAKREWFFLSGTLDGFEPHWDEFDATTGTLPGTIHDLKTAATWAVNATIDGSAAKKNKYGHPTKDTYVEQ